MLSKLFFCGNRITLSLLGKQILHNLVSSPPDSLHGILIVADAPECNNVTLNVKRPGVLCQYYGCGVSEVNGNTVTWVGYRSQTSISSEGSDYAKLVIKPFSPKMYLMAEYIHNVLVQNQLLLDLESVDLSKSFNSCTILMYHSLKGYKSESSMGWHCDSKYSTGGKFKEKYNG